MEEEANWESELILFSEDVIKYLLIRHPLLHVPHNSTSGSRYFKNDFGKCVILRWHEIRNGLQQNLRSNYPQFVETKKSFELYLKVFVDDIIQMKQGVINQIYEICAVLLEILCFVQEKGLTDFIQDAANYLRFMLSNVNEEKFMEEGGWYSLLSLSSQLSKSFDEEELCKQYLPTTVCNLSVSDSTEIGDIGSNSGCFTEISQGDLSVLEKSSEKSEIGLSNEIQSNSNVALISHGHKDETESNSANAKITSDEVLRDNSKDVSISYKREDENERRDSVNLKETSDEVRDNSKDVSMSYKRKDENQSRDSVNLKETSDEVRDNSKDVSMSYKREDENQSQDSANLEETSTEVRDNSKDVSMSYKREDENQSQDSANLEETSDEVRDNSKDVLMSCIHEEEPESDPVNVKETSNEVDDNSQSISLSCETKEESEKTNVKQISNQVHDSCKVASSSVKYEEPENNSSNVKEISNEVLEKNYEQVMSCEHEARKDYQIIDSTLCETTTTEAKNVSTEHNLNDLKNELSTTFSSDSTVQPLKCNERLNESMLETSVNQNASVSFEVNPESLQVPKDENKTNCSKSSSENTVNGTVDFANLKNSPGKRSELSKEVDQFLIKEISRFQVNFVVKYEDVEAMFKDELRPTIDNAYQISSTGETSNTTDVVQDPEEKDEQRDPTARILLQDEVSQFDLVSANNNQMEDVDTTEVPEKAPIPSKPICIKEKTSKKDSNLLKPPKVEISKKLTPVQPNTPIVDKGNNKVSKNKTPQCNTFEKVTLRKTPVARSPPLSSTEKSVTESPKLVKPVSNESKSRSPYFKTPPDRRVTRLQSKSSEKTEKGQNLFPPKSTEKSSTKSTHPSATKNKPFKRELSDPSKPSSSVAQSELSNQDRVLNELLKSPSTTSESVPKRKENRTNIACETSKSKVQPVDAKAESCQKTEGASAVSTDASASKSYKTSTESLNSVSSKGESSGPIQKSDQRKGRKYGIASSKKSNSSTACRARNIPGKTTSTDSKNEKPRWR